MKKTTLISVLFLSFTFVPSAYAQFTQPGDSQGTNSVTGTSAATPGTTAATTQTNNQVQNSNTTSGFVALAPIEGLTRGVVANQTGLANFFNNLYKYLIGLAAALAVIMIIWGGLEYSTQDSISKKSDGKERIYQAIFGLILVLSPVLVFSIINPSILNLSVNLPPLDTRTAAPAVATSCPAGTIGTPPNCLPPCVGGRRTNCNRAESTQEGASDTPVSGQYCYMRVDPTRADSSAEYVCAATQTLCDNLYSEQIRNDGSNAFVGSSCRLR